MEPQINCAMCSRVTDKSIKMSLLGGIRGTGPSRMTYYCSTSCLNEFMETRMCQSCSCASYEMELINGHSVCSDSSQWMEKPTCKHKYDGIFQCDFCDKEKNGISYLIEKDDELCELDGKYNETFLIMCDDCFNPHKKHISEDNSEKLYTPRMIHIYYNNPCREHIRQLYITKFKFSDCTELSTVNDLKKMLNTLHAQNQTAELLEVHKFLCGLLNIV